MTLLSVRGLHAFYGDSHVLHGLDFELARGELVTLIGRNGAGKTTTLRALMGLVQRRGSVLLKDAQTVAWAPERIARLGMAYVPEDRGIFASLTVEENLMLPPVVAAGGLTLAEIYRLFPNLLERRRNPGTRLSGGEQQMLAIARVLRTGADLILLDEPTEGLAPVVVQQIAQAVKLLKARGFTVLLVEQNLAFAELLADRHYLVEDGRIAGCVAAQDLARPGQRERIHRCLGL
ncbi:MAG: ABC transporter ATP-binding protein [Pseudomonadota bacterium]